MLALLRDPVPSLRLVLLSIAAGVAVAAYCLIYRALSGDPETLANALTWSIVNVVPWVPALEGAKRARTLLGATLALASGFAASVLLGLGFAGTTESVAFEAWRRVPALLLVSFLALGLRWTNRKGRANDNDELPLLPRQIDWVRAAGNYVELRGCGRTLVHRASLTLLEQQLTSYGFVRIHRSMLVRRDCIARVRPQDVVLSDGTHLKIGKRYRAALAA